MSICFEDSSSIVQEGRASAVRQREDFQGGVRAVVEHGVKNIRDKVVFRGD
jgi:hypothetical protein